MPYRSVAENVFLGVEPMKNACSDRSLMRQRTKELLKRVGSDIDPAAQVNSFVDCPAADRRDREGAAARRPNPRPRRTDRRARRTRGENASGAGRRSTQAGHRHHLHLPQDARTDGAARPDHRAQGRRQGVDPRARGIDLATIVNAMSAAISRTFIRSRPKPRLARCCCRSENGSNAELHDICLTLRSGEIVGVGGLEDSGKTALARAIFGDQPFASGSIAIEGQTKPIGSPRHAIAAGIGYLPGRPQARGAGDDAVRARQRPFDAACQ